MGFALCISATGHYNPPNAAAWVLLRLKTIAYIYPPVSMPRNVQMGVAGFWFIGHPTTAVNGNVEGTQRLYPFVCRVCIILRCRTPGH